MKDFVTKHPDLLDLLLRNPGLKIYMYHNIHGDLVEAWEKNDDGHWIDVTEREKLKIQIAKEQEELEKLIAKEKKESK